MSVLHGFGFIVEGCIICGKSFFWHLPQVISIFFVYLAYQGEVQREITAEDLMKE